MAIMARLRLGWGVVRRAYLHTFNRDYVRRGIKRRSGDCRRCGACCKLTIRCPDLEENGPENCACARHATRWTNCRIFPVDERDIADRDQVSGDGPCGYRFDPPMKPQRWLVLALAATIGVSFGARGAAPRSALKETLVLKASFRRGRMPSGWRIESGRWEFRGGGLHCKEQGSIAALLRDDMLPVEQVDVRIDVWAEFKGRRPEARFRGIAAVWGDLRAEVSESGECSVSIRGETASGPLARALAGRFHMAVSLERGLVTVRLGRMPSLVMRDVFHGLELKPPRDVEITAVPGAVIHAVRIVARPAPPRPEALAAGDRAYLGGELAAAAALYAAAVADDELAASGRAEAAYKFGLILVRRGSETDALAVFDRAKRLGPEGPWGERARVALGEAALAAGELDTALRFAHLAAAKAASGVEDWPGFMSLVSRAREKMTAAGSGPLATFRLRRIAERIEWAGNSPDLARWAWEEAALAYDGRGWTDEAERVRRRARALFGRIAADAAAESPDPAEAPRPRLATEDTEDTESTESTESTERR